MKKIIFAVLIAAVLATGAILVVGQKADGDKRGRFGHGKFGHGGGPMMALRALNLTDEQKAKVKEIMADSRATMQPLGQQMHDNHAKLAGLGADGKFDQVQVEALAANQGDLMAKMIVEKEKVKSQIASILTDEQKAKAAEMRTGFMERGKGKKDGAPKPADPGMYDLPFPRGNK